eukprot:13769669-Heterocapsa_arctica.AAC.1
MNNLEKPVQTPCAPACVRTCGARCQSYNITCYTILHYTILHTTLHYTTLEWPPQAQQDWPATPPHSEMSSGARRLMPMPDSRIPGICAFLLT